MKTLEQVAEELLGVLLRVTHETGRETLDLRLERDGVDYSVERILAPELFYHLCERCETVTRYGRRKTTTVSTATHLS